MAKVSNKAGVKGFGKAPGDEAGDRGWLGHEGPFAEEGDVYGDHEHMHRHRTMDKDGEFHLDDHKPANWESKGRSEFEQGIDPHEMRFKHKEANAGVLLGARGGASHDEWEGQDVRYAKNKFMDRAGTSGATHPWKPKGRAQAERASKDVKG